MLEFPRWRGSLDVYRHHIRRSSRHGRRAGPRLFRTNGIRPHTRRKFSGHQTVLLIALLGFLTGRPDFLDIAIVYAMINFIAVVAVLKFVKYGDLASSGGGEGSP